VLSIIGLAGGFPNFMASIATIAIGVGLLAYSGTTSSRIAHALRHGEHGERLQVGGGLGSEVLGGVAAIALGILALVHVIPTVLLPIAAIVLGGAILFGAPTQHDMAKRTRTGEHEGFHERIEGTSGAMVLAGAAAIVLGILGLLHVGPRLMMSLAAMLVLGGALFLESSTFTARFAVRRLRHT
jgi:hypothetical protein